MMDHKLCAGDVVVYTGRPSYWGFEAGDLGIVVSESDHAVVVYFGARAGVLDHLFPLVSRYDLEIIDHIDIHVGTTGNVLSTSMSPSNTELPIVGEDRVLQLSAGNRVARVVCKSCGHVVREISLVP